MAIPKIIHYVWVGNNEKPKDIKRCMETWKKHLKDYEIIEWNDMLDYYDNKSFEFDKNNQYDKVNTKTVSDILIEDYDCKIGNQEQMLREGIKVYKDDVLCNPSVNSKTIHIFTGTWLEGNSSFVRNVNKFIKLRLTNKSRLKLYSYYRNIKFK